MPPHSLGIRLRTEAEPRRQCERVRHADRDGFAMEQHIAETGLGLKGMAERVAQVEERAVALLTFVARNDCSLGATTRHNRVPQSILLVRKNARPVLLKPVEEGRIADQAILYHLGVTGPHLARWQRLQDCGIGDDCAWLVEKAHKVFAVSGVDRRLAANRTVHLCEERGRNLDVRQAAQQEARGDAGDIANHAPAERDDDGRPLDARIQQGLAQPLQGRKVLGLLTRRQHDVCGLDARPCKRRLQPLQAEGGNGGIGDDGCTLERQHAREQRAGLVNQVLADKNVVRPRPQGDGDPSGRSPGIRAPRHQRSPAGSTEGSREGSPEPGDPGNCWRESASMIRQTVTWAGS